MVAQGRLALAALQKSCSQQFVDASSPNALGTYWGVKQKTVIGQMDLLDATVRMD